MLALGQLALPVLKVQLVRLAALLVRLVLPVQLVRLVLRVRLVLLVLALQVRPDPKVALVVRLAPLV